jgi:hypothetical protein
VGTLSPPVTIKKKKKVATTESKGGTAG